jgi:hypothetical protein
MSLKRAIELAPPGPPHFLSHICAFWLPDGLIPLRGAVEGSAHSV